MTALGTPIRVLLVQANSLQRTQLVEVLQRDGDIRVLGPAASATDAISTVQHDRPDIVVIDLQLADGGSQYAVEQIMARNPTPILVLSSRIADRRSPRAVEALVAGALDALPTPTPGDTRSEGELRHCVRQLRKVTVIRHPRGGRTTPPPRPALAGRTPVVAIGASTGGPTAVATVLSGLAGLAAPVLIVQHLHPDFTSGLLDLLARSSALPVRMAEQGVVLQPGTVYLAPGHQHLKLGAGSRVELDPQPLALHRPSADELFSSLAVHAGPAGIGVLLTGMGEDGARGLLELHRRGGRTLAQDQATSAVFGMPQAAARLGAVNDLLPLGQLAAAVVRAVGEVRR
ncbi:chemotaxis protein CheB [Nakamurella deserti]|uniref:chemotaxis protein CheB n=1 Tax=Nakamurella deserti TaxID=2164074 RepID=UPI000DBE4846|nr:chemotaxis protein CheB [Nakamurella deserti]